MFERGLEYEKGLSLTGFREEAFLSLRARMLGYTCMVDTGAVAWHAPAQSGGCRSQDYETRVRNDDNAFKKWARKNADALIKLDPNFMEATP